MYSNFLMDPALPDLLPEGSLFDNLLYSDVTALAITHPDIATLNHRLDQLSLDTNTQSLRIDVEKAKRQKLSAIVRPVKQNILLPCPEIASLKQDITTIRGEQNTVNYHLEAKIASTSVMTFRCLSRIHQILTFLLPHVMLLSNSNHELNQLLQELAQTLQQFRVEYMVSYV